MAESKKVPTLTEITRKEKVEVLVDHIDLPGHRDGVRLGAMPPTEAQLLQEEASCGEVHVWEENTKGDLAEVHPDFTPQVMNSDQIGG